MNFEFTGAFYVSEDDLKAMVRLCKTRKITPQEALNIVAEKWDDCDYYMTYLVENKIVAEIEKRLASPR